MKPAALPEIPESLKSSPTWPYVLRFALEMEAMLEKNRHKGDRPGWMAADPEALLDDAAKNLDRADSLVYGVRHGDADKQQARRSELISRAANVANFCMMVADRAGALTPEDGEVTQPDARPLGACEQGEHEPLPGSPDRCAFGEHPSTPGLGIVDPDDSGRAPAGDWADRVLDGGDEDDSEPEHVEEPDRNDYNDWRRER